MFRCGLRGVLGIPGVVCRRARSVNQSLNNKKIAEKLLDRVGGGTCV